MIELLKLCGFKEQELEVELPRVEKAFKRLGINDEDIERGKQRLNKYYDVKLEGVRKVLRLYIRQMVAVLLAKEEGKKKVIYSFMDPTISTIGSALMSKNKEVSAAYFNDVFLIVVGSIFDKLVPILEAAEKKWLKAGAVVHCANVKEIVGLITLDLLPKPDLIATSGALCETAPKTLDLFHDVYGLPICCYNTCMDRGVGDEPEASNRVVHLAARSMRSYTKNIQEVIGTEITDDMLWEVINARSRLDDVMRKLQDIIENSDPLPISPTHQILWSALTNFPQSLDSLPEIIDALNTLCEELQERVDKGIGVVEKGAPRILTMHVPHLSDPRLEHLLCEMGIMSIVASGTRESVPHDEEPQDPYVKICKYLQMGELSFPAKRIPLIIESCKSLKVNGVLDRFHAGCRTLAGDALMIEEAVRKELGIPVLVLEWDNFDPRVYNHEEYKRRLEVFKGMMTKRSA